MERSDKLSGLGGIGGLGLLALADEGAGETLGEEEDAVRMESCSSGGAICGDDAESGAIAGSSHLCNLEEEVLMLSVLERERSDDEMVGLVCSESSDD